MAHTTYKRADASETLTLPGNGNQLEAIIFVLWYSALRVNDKFILEWQPHTSRAERLLRWERKNAETEKRTPRTFPIIFKLRDRLMLKVFYAIYLLLLHSSGRAMLKRKSRSRSNYMRPRSSTVIWGIFGDWYLMKPNPLRLWAGFIEPWVWSWLRLSKIMINIFFLWTFISFSSGNWTS